jgi:PAS domain S-box-containing protein
LTDNTERGKLAELLLEESLEDLYEHAPCAYVSTLPDGSLVKVNQTFLSWTGYPREGLLGDRRFQDLLTIPGKIYYDTHYSPLLYMQGFVNEVALDLVCRDGHQLPVLVNASQKRDECGAPLLNRITIFNATDRREYERELLMARRQAEQAAQTKARSLSMISHEIRNALSGIVLAAQALERSSHEPKQQKYIRTLKSSSRNLLALVNTMLDFSQIDAGMVQLGEQPFDPSELLNEVVSSLEGKAEEKKLALGVVIDPRVPASLIGDPLRIGQILINLASNALKFTERGSVTLALQLEDLRPHSAALRFSVQDTGIGIAPDRLNDIFEEFTQASSDISLKYGGTGLGLAICQRLAHLYGSEIHVESALGAGSTFYFVLVLKRIADGG